MQPPPIYPDPNPNHRPPPSLTLTLTITPAHRPAARAVGAPSLLPALGRDALHPRGHRSRAADAGGGGGGCSSSQESTESPRARRYRACWGGRRGHRRPGGLEPQPAHGSQAGCMQTPNPHTRAARYRKDQWYHSFNPNPNPNPNPTPTPNPGTGKTKTACR